MLKKYSMLPMAVLFVLFTSASSCTQTIQEHTPPPPRNVVQGLVYAEMTATIANQVATGLLEAKAISPDSAQTVLNTTGTVMQAVQSGRAMLVVNNQAGAQAALDSVSQQLQTLSSFNASHITPQGVTP